MAKRWELQQVLFGRRPSRHPSSTSTYLKAGTQIAIVTLILLFLGQSMANMSASEDAGLQVLHLPIRARLVEALMAVLSVALVTVVYTVLIQRGSLMATTCLYPKRPIEENIRNLLSATWPQSCSDPDVDLSERSIRLYYVGKLSGEMGPHRIAKGRVESSATPIGPEKKRSLWLTSGSALTKNVLQVLIWEYVSLWLMVLMTVGTLLFNGFFTNNLNPDSYPRLTVMLIYLVAYAMHFCYVWLVCLDFFRIVFGGAAWSLLERAKFVVADRNKLRRHSTGTIFEFRSIDKASDTFVPTVVNGVFGASVTSPEVLSSSSTLSISSKSNTAVTVVEKSITQGEKDDPAEVRAALATIDSAQKNERNIATDAATLALDRVMANAMVMMAVTLSSGFASWTSTQLSEQTPNNTTTTQIGSLALLTSLSLGTGAMFTSAMNLNIMACAFRNIVSLKETKINGLAVDHYRKRRSGVGDGGVDPVLEPVAFTRDTVSLALVEMSDFIGGLRSRGWASVLGLLLFGPAYVLLPRPGDHDRRSAEVDFDFVAPLSANSGTAVLTTRNTNKNAKMEDGVNVDPINVCFLPDDNKFGKEIC